MKNSIIKFRHSITALLMIVLYGAAAFAAAPWTVNPGDYRYDMSLYLDVVIGGVGMDRAKYDVAAFCGDECRGTAEVLPLGNGKDCLYMRVRSNSPSGETMTFRLYDKEKEKVCDIDAPTFAFEQDGRLGYPSDPYKVGLTIMHQVKITAGPGGTVAPEGGRIADGTSLTVTATPDEGHGFMKWSDGETVNPRRVVVNGDIELAAEFKVNTYTLTYMLDGEVYSSSEVTFGSALTAVADPTKEGHSFSGWSGLPATMPAHDVTVTGSYTVNTYTLTYMLDGEVYSTSQVEYGTELTAEAAPTREGFTFGGWQGLPATMPAHDVTVTGTFGVNTYTLTYIVDGETYRTSQVAYGTALTAEADPTKEGHTFSGWSGLPATMPANDVTVTGSFSVNAYKLTYMLDGEVYAEYGVEYGASITPEAAPVREGETFSGWQGLPTTMPARDVTVNGTFSANSYKAEFTIDGEVIETRFFDYGAAVTTPDAPAKEGHTFAGWKDVPATMPAHDITITGSYTVNTYTLTYMLDGEVYSTSQVEYGTELTAEAAPTREGFTFGGWQGLPATMPAHDVTVTGTFGVNTYTLTYIVDGETYRTSQVAYGTALTAEADPTKEGHTFSGWNGLPETMPANDVTVTGSFSVNTYKLTYMLDGEVYRTYEVEYGASITPEAAPVREGETFSGWQGLPETMPARDVTVNGTFSANSYRAEFTIDGEVIETRFFDYGAVVSTPDAPAKEGHTFAGWQDVPATMPAHDITVTGSYTVNTYTLTYMLDGEVYSTSQVEYGTELTAEAAPTREGFTFGGWQGLPATMPAHDVTVTGSFGVNTYTLTYIVDGETYRTSQVAYGTALTAEADPTKEGHTFSGWSGLPATMPANDVTVTGSFSVNTYTLTYMLDGEVYAEYSVEYGSAITPEAAPVREGETFSGWQGLPETMPARDVTVNGTFSANSYKAEFAIDGEVIETRFFDYGAVVSTPDAPAKEGHTFAGWQDVPATMPAHDITVTGSYTVNTYTLTYMLDGQVYKTYEIEYGAAITPEADPVREGETFSGWMGVPQTMPAHDVTVSGSFSNTVYRATFVIDGETVETRLIEFGAVVTTPDAPAKEGHTFAGWQDVPATMPAHDITVTGSYTVNTYTLTYMLDGQVYKTYEVEYGTAITPEPDPIREGETFSGWVGVPETMPAHDVTVSGSFGVNTYTLTYMVDGEVYRTYQVAYGTALTAEADPTKEGHTFSGWSGLPETMPAHDVTVTGSFTVNTYTLTYMLDGEVYAVYSVEYGAVITPEADPTMEGETFSGWQGLPETMPARDVTVNGTFSANSYRAEFTIDGEVIETRFFDYGAVVSTPDAPAKEGHTFAGWQDVPATMPAHDITVTGSYTVNTYTLTYMLDGQVYKTYEIEYGAVITPEADPVREGETFSGWQGLPETMPAHDVTVNGSFSNTVYKATFVIDGEAVETRLIEFGAVVTAPDAPAKEGHTFAGWQDVPATMPAHDITVTGSYTVNTYTLTYMLDGQVYRTYEVEYGTAVTPEADPVREGETFSGWVGVPQTMPAHDVTVSGSFGVNTYTLTYIVDGEVYRTYQVAYGTALTAEVDPTKEGHTFSGWSGLPETMPAHDVTVTGSFTVNTYTLTYMLDGEVYAVYSVEYGAVITPEADPTMEGETFSGWQGLPETMPARDVTVNGTFSTNSYTAMFVIDGETIETRFFEFGAAVTTPDAPAKEGHTFAGWQDVPATMPAHDITIAGSYTVNTYTLTYMLDGQVYKTYEVEYGAVITPEADPVREGETFSGWVGIPQTMPAHDVTVTGSFSNTVYRATFVIDGETVETRLIEFGAVVTAPDAPAKEGHTFAGWQDVPATMPAHDITVTGSYTVNTYTLTYMLDGQVYKTYEVEYGTAITPEPDPIREGETFSGWVGVPETMPAHDVTVSGSFGVNTYTLTYMVDGEVYRAYQVAYGTALTAEVDPTKEGHTFSGWSGLPETMPAHDVTVTGSFTVNTYTLTYMLDGEVYAVYSVEYGAVITPEADPTMEGETFSGWQGLPETMPARDVTVNGTFSTNSYTAMFVIDGETIETRFFEFGAAVTTPDAPAKEGHTFAGWQDVPATMPAHDITVTGSYTVNTYTLTYMLDGQVYKTYEVEYGTAITPEPDPIREGETFSGWVGVPETMPAHDVTVSGSFGVNTYTLTYMVDGEVYRTYQVAYGTALTAEADPTKEGHTFSGWSGLPETMPAHDVTVTGSFTVNTYTLTYMLDGEVYAVYSVEYGAVITPEADPTMEGETFSGWQGLPETMPARDVTVNGTFSTNSYKAMFVIDGEVIETRFFEFGAVVTTPDAPAKEGHTFAGWQDVPATMPAHDITVTGSYTVNTYTLTYMLDGQVYKTYEVEYGTAITPEADPVREGETFSGWVGVPQTMPAHDVTVSGSFGVNTYTLTYIVDGEVYRTTQVAYGTALTAEADPTKEGHTFSGWSGLPETMPAHDVTVTGSFTVNTYTLTYMLDGEVYAVYSVEYGAVITPEADPTMEGETFSGWQGLPQTMPARDVTVNGTFSTNSYKAMFVIDGEVIETRFFEFGAAVTTPDAPAKEGHTFAGWQDVPATMPARDITVTGSYTVNTYTLTYMLDGQVYRTYEVEYGSAITPEADPVREGETFSGWQGVPQTMPAHDVTVSGSFSNTVYRATFVIDGETVETRLIEFGAVVTTPDAPAKEGHTFAGWQDVPATMPAHDITVTGSYTVNTYTLTYMLDGQVYKTYEVEYGTAITPEADPVREGETFSGWQGLPQAMPAHDVTVTGSFGVNTYTLTYMVDGEVYRAYQVAYGSALTAEAAPTKEGHTFSGWSGLPETMPAHDVTVTGTFSVNTYTLTYMLDGEVYKTYEVEYGTAITPEADPVREGETFSGWQGIPETMPAHDVTVTGSFGVNTYTLTYMVDGEVYRTYQVAYGSALTAEAAPTKEGHTFSGWSGLPETMPAHDVTVTGSFTVNTYTLTYMLDGEVYAVYSVEYGAVITPEADPTMEGETFSGWQGLPETMPARDVTVNGTFSTNSYKAMFVIDGETIETRFFEFGAVVTTPDAPAKEGHTFAGWQDVPTTMPAHDITITGSYTVNTYTLTYMLDGEVYSTSQVAYGTRLTAVEAPTKEGFTFSGWSGLPETMPAHDVVVTGSFGINTYTLTYMVDGDVYRTYQVAYGTALTAEAEPTKEGHTFSGWSGLPATMPAHDVTVTGSFGVNIYTLTYMLDGEVYKECKVEYGAAITPEADPTKEGHTFGGWSGLPATMPARDVTVSGTFSVNTYTAIFVIDGETVETRLFEFGSEVTTPDAPAKEGHTFAGWQDVPATMPAHDITIAGSYTVNSYTLTYMLDGDVYAEYNVEYGASITPEADPVKEGFTFSGWVGVPETMPARDVTVYGSFSNTVYKATFVIDGETIETRLIEYGAEVTTPDAPEREGHTFAGWQDVPATMPAHDITIIGSYTVNSYKLTYMLDGEVYAEYDVEYGAAITPEADTTKEGHTFGGWQGLPETMPAHDVTVTGSFSVNTYTATFVIDGETIETRAFEYGAEVTTPDAPEREGHTFDGWQDVPETMPAHDITITGSYTEIPESERAEIRYNGRYVTIECADPDARILWHHEDADTADFTEYSGPFDAMGLHTVTAVTEKEGFRRSEPTSYTIMSYADETHAETRGAGHLADAFGWMAANELEAIEEYDVLGHLDADDYSAIRAMKALADLDLSGVFSTDMPDHALAGMDLVTLRLPSGAESYGNGIVDGDDALCAMFANSAAPLTAGTFGTFRNPNLLLYLTDAAAYAGGVDWLTNVITLEKGWEADAIRLTDGQPFHCPEAFNAGEVAFEKSFSRPTVIGGMQGWETLSLPFAVDEIRHKDWQLQPFGAYEATDSTRPFWLQEAGGNGWTKAQAVEAYRPYLISMPNCELYDESFNIEGAVTFIGGGQTIAATPDPEAEAWKSGHWLWANFSRIPKEEGLLVTNSLETDGPAGSMFVAGEHDVEPFECYVTTVTGRRMIPIFDSSEVEMLTGNILRIWSEEGDILIESPVDTDASVHDLAGQLVRTVSVAAGVTTRIAGLTPGVYFVNSTKVLVK